MCGHKGLEVSDQANCRWERRFGQSLFWGAKICYDVSCWIKTVKLFEKWNKITIFWFSANNEWMWGVGAIKSSKVWMGEEILSIGYVIRWDVVKNCETLWKMEETHHFLYILSIMGGSEGVEASNQAKCCQEGRHGWSWLRSANNMIM